MTDIENREKKEELRQLLRRLVQRVTKQTFATTRQKQLDVGNAISLLNRIEKFPERLILQRALAEMLRELGKRRPDLHRHVVVIEKSIVQLGEDVERM
jgi:hypothetical protein